jgi:hypothetical protein
MRLPFGCEAMCRMIGVWGEHGFSEMAPRAHVLVYHARWCTATSVQRIICDREPTHE